MSEPKLIQKLYASIPALSAMYNERHRSYHSIEHVQELISKIVTGKYAEYLDYAKVQELCKKHSHMRSVFDREEVLQTIAWFHDCYYDPYLGSPQNEEMSAKIAESMLSDGITGHEFEKFLVSIEGIRLTARHLDDVTEYGSYLSLEALIFMDLDMRSFSDKEEFTRNNQRVRDEYYKTGELDYMRGREKFLTKLLAKKKIYYTFLDVYEQAARINISAGLEEVRHFLKQNDVAKVP